MTEARTPPKVRRPEPAPRISSPAVAELKNLLAIADSAADPAAAREEVLHEFHTVASETPLFEKSGRPGHTIVTFLFWDATAADVLLFANRLTDERDIVRSLMDRVPGTPIWSLSYLMRDDWRASYAFVPLKSWQGARLREADAGAGAGAGAGLGAGAGAGAGVAGLAAPAGAGATPGSAAPGAELNRPDQLRLRELLDRGVPDPRNSVRCMNRVRKPMSIVSLPDALHDPWPADCIAVQHPEIYTGLAGTLQHAAMPGDTGPDGQELWLYEPPPLKAETGAAAGAAANTAAGRAVDRADPAQSGGPDEPAGRFADGDLPLLVVLDGDTWLTQQHLHRILERQMLAGELPPLRALFVASGGRENRWQRLHAAAEFETVLVESVLPWARTHWRLPASCPTVLTGQSLAGYVAITAGLRHPRAFNHVIAQSASLWQADPFQALARHGSRHSFEAADSPQLHIQVGLQEWVLLEPHRDLVRNLREQGWNVTATEYNGGHDYVLWRAHLVETLRRVLR